MKLYPCKEYIPLILCKSTNTVINVSNRKERICCKKTEMFTNAVTISDDCIYNIETPQSSNYLYDKYTLVDTLDNILVVACKINDTHLDIPEKDRWIIMKNSERDSTVSGRFIKNVLNITGRKQIVCLSDWDIDQMFNGLLTVSMKMYTPEYQKEMSTAFLNEIKSSIDV